MFKHILVPTDGSLRAERSSRAAIELAKYLDAAVVALYVFPPYQIIATETNVVASGLISEKAYTKAQRAAAKRYLGVIDKAARAAGVPCNSLCVEHDSPAAAIVATAASTETPCDLVFMGSHGRSLFSQMFLGSVTTKVQSMCDVPVLVYRDRKAQPPTKKSASRKKASRKRKT